MRRASVLPKSCGGIKFAEPLFRRNAGAHGPESVGRSGLRELQELLCLPCRPPSHRPCLSHRRLSRSRACRPASRLRRGPVNRFPGRGPHDGCRVPLQVSRSLDLGRLHHRNRRRPSVRVRMYLRGLACPWKNRLPLPRVRRKRRRVRPSRPSGVESANRMLYPEASSQPS
jgi:hypothetical protein